MAKNRESQASTERRNWDKIFNGLTQMLQTQQKQLETLVTERKVLEDRVRMQHDRWVFDIRLYEDQISQMKEEFLLQDMERSLDASKSVLLAGMKETEARLYQLKLEHSESDLEDFISLFNLASQKCFDPLGISSESAPKTAEEIGGRETRCSKALEDEVRRLAREYEKLASEKRSEVSALMAEKKFVWNQLNVMENNYSINLRRKDLELELATQKIEKLVTTMEKLQSSSNEKDDIIATLETQVGKMEADSSKLKEEFFRLSHELEMQKKSANVTPVLNRCITGTKTTSLRGKNRSNVTVNKDTPSLQASQSGRVKRRGAEVISNLGTPKLFSPSFKVPKLKNEVNL